MFLVLEFIYGLSQFFMVKLLYLMYLDGPFDQLQKNTKRLFGCGADTAGARERIRTRMKLVSRALAWAMIYNTDI